MTNNTGGSGSGPESGSGSGSSSGGSGETARPKEAPNPPESITFTFSSRNSPFAHLSPPGSVSFLSNKRRGSDSSRDRSNRKPQSSQSSLGPGWITLPPLKPVTEISPPLFDTPGSLNTAPPRPNTAVFSSRSPTSARTSPRLSLTAQHYHATSQHPLFNTPPALITPPPQDPFGQLRRPSYDGYFPPMPASSKDSSSRHRKKSSKPKPQPSRVRIEQPQPMHLSSRSNTSRTPAGKLLESGTSESTPRALSRIGHEPLDKRSALIPVAGSPSASTPTQLKSRSRKSTPPNRKTPPDPPPPKSGSPQPQPSIDAFRDCFGVLTRHIENVFPTRERHCTSRSNSGGSENFNVMGSGPSLNEFQRRWTRRWIRRTIRGVGSMGSGSTSSGSAGAGVSRLRGGGSTPRSSSLVNTMIYMGLGSGTAEEQEMRGSDGTGSQDSLDRVRVSRSNAPSPSNSNASGRTNMAEESNMVKAKDFGGSQSLNEPKPTSVQPTDTIQS